MKIIIIATLVMLLAFDTHAQIGLGTNTPDSSAVLDVFSTTKGFLLPRLALINTDSSAPVHHPATGLLVYNTATAGPVPFNVVPGFYYWNSSRWYPVVNKGANPGDMQYWNGSKWILIPIGVQGQTLTVCGGIPTWGPCPSSITTLSPSNNQYEGWIESQNLSTWEPSGSELLIGAWTVNGNPIYLREQLKFDYSTIPFGATIDSAKLYLYADSTPSYGNGVDAMYGTGNSFYISRITSPFTLPNPYTWSSPPAISVTNQVLVPPSNSSFENSVVTVTGMVKDMIATNNYGFNMQLQSESIYNIRQYVSSFDASVNRHPKLVVYYH